MTCPEPVHRSRPVEILPGLLQNDMRTERNQKTVKTNNKTNKTAVINRSIAEADAQSLFDQALQTYVSASVAFVSTGKALPLMLADRTPAQNALEKTLQDAMQDALGVLNSTIDLHTSQQIAAALADL